MISKQNEALSWNRLVHRNSKIETGNYELYVDIRESVVL